MQISTWPLTRFSSRWKTGRRSRSSALTCRKSRSTYLRFLVGGDDAGRVEFAVRYGSAQDVDPVESGFLLDLVLPALDGQAVIGNGDLEVLGHLVLADHLADGDADRVRAGELAAATRAAIGARSFSVAASKSSRLRARSSASTGLRQATSRSPGKPGEVISAEIEALGLDLLEIRQLARHRKSPESGDSCSP